MDQPNVMVGIVPITEQNLCHSLKHIQILSLQISYSSSQESLIVVCPRPRPRPWQAQTGPQAALPPALSSEPDFVVSHPSADIYINTLPNRVGQIPFRARSLASALSRNCRKFRLGLRGRHVGKTQI